MLHIVNKSPFTTTSLESCLRVAKPGATILLIEDGVYGALDGSRVRTLAAGWYEHGRSEPDLMALLSVCSAPTPRHVASPTRCLTASAWWITTVSSIWWPPTTASSPGSESICETRSEEA